MDNFELIKQGAEAKLYQGTYLGKPSLIKQRFNKKYRQPELDAQITTERIKSEARILSRCLGIGIKVPALYHVDLKRSLIVMQFIENSETLKDFFNKSSIKEKEGMCREIGQSLGKMHQNNIIHGDLTSSNMLIINNNKLVFIDFGLSYIEASPEDKAVDLYVLERALISTHQDGVNLFTHILQAYTGTDQSKHVLSKFKEVRARGRKRTMVG